MVSVVLHVPTKLSLSDIVINWLPASLPFNQAKSNMTCHLTVCQDVLSSMKLRTAINIWESDKLV